MDRQHRDLSLSLRFPFGLPQSSRGLCVLHIAEAHLRHIQSFCLDAHLRHVVPHILIFDGLDRLVSLIHVSHGQIEGEVDEGLLHLRIGAINLLKVRDGFDLHSGVACRVGTGEPGIEVQIGHRKPYKCREVPVQGHGFLWHDTLVTVHEQCGHLNPGGGLAVLESGSLLYDPEPPGLARQQSRFFLVPAVGDREPGLGHEIIVVHLVPIHVVHMQFCALDEMPGLILGLGQNAHL
mmetsp:Transcript_24204/g.41670  ORF Transcript_24204/g.41670 Transcript_24204/m.41670 type:complete len:236 (-) Transcript_24204:481-1188(-)